MSLRLINHTNITLISKVDNPEVVSNYRPISLCSVSFKIITKIIIHRLNPLLDKIIYKNQGAFASGQIMFWSHLRCSQVLKGRNVRME